MIEWKEIREEGTGELEKLIFEGTCELSTLKQLAAMHGRMNENEVNGHPPRSLFISSINYNGQAGKKRVPVLIELTPIARTFRPLDFTTLETMVS